MTVDNRRQMCKASSLMTPATFSYCLLGDIQKHRQTHAKNKETCKERTFCSSYKPVSGLARFVFWHQPASLSDQRILHLSVGFLFADGRKRKCSLQALYSAWNRKEREREKYFIKLGTNFSRLSNRIAL